MMPESAFNGINVILIFAGATIHKSGWANLAAIAIRTLLYCTLVFHISILPIRSSKERMWIPVRLVAFIEFVLIFCNSILLISKKQEIRRILNEISNLSHRKLTAFSKRLTFAFVFAYLFVILTKTLIYQYNCIYFLSYNFVCNGIRYYVMYLIYPIFFLDWTLISWFVYIVMLISLRKVEVSALQGLANGLNRTKSLSCLRSHEPLHHKIASMKEAFEKNFNIFPLLWLAMLFSQGSCFTMWFRITSHDDSLELSLKLSTYFINLLLTFSICFLNKKLNEAVALEASKVIHLSSNIMVCDDYKLLQLLKGIKKSDLKLTAWGMFEMKKSMVLSFIGAIVTFTVLFVQIYEKGI